MTRDLQGEDGASAVEYGLLITGIAAIICAVVLLFGGFVEGIFAQTCATVDGERVAHAQPAVECE